MAGTDAYDDERFSAAESLWKSALKQAERGGDEARLLTSLGDLLLNHVAQGRYAEGEPIYRRACRIAEKTPDSAAPEMVSALNDLAVFFGRRHPQTESERCHLGALAKVESALGLERLDRAPARLHKLARSYFKSGQYARAEPLCQRALLISESADGSKHPTVAASLDRLAVLYDAQGRHDEAEPLCHRSLMIRKKALRPGNPHLATSLNNLGALYVTQSRYAEAEPLFHRALAILEEAFGPQDPRLAIVLENHAMLLRNTGRDADAEEQVLGARAVRAAGSVQWVLDSAEFICRV